mgnify:CR=1 FL=1
MRFLTNKWLKIIFFFNNLINIAIDKLNFYKKLNNYILILESIIDYLNISIKIVDKNNKCIIQDDLFKNDFTVDYNSLVQIDGETYKYKNYSFKYFYIFLLIKITKEIKEEKQKETTLATIVHDLKSPIISCEKAIYLINNEQFGPLNASQHEVLEMCYSSLTFSKYLIGNILCNYKQSQQCFGLSVEQFDIIKLIKECVKEIGIFAKEKYLNIILNIPNTFEIKADKNELKRVLTNLIYNAIAYSTIKSDIDIIMTYDEKNILFRVKNQGEYIPPEQIKEIFKKNISLKNKYNKIGTGLGLYLSKEIIVAHGGEMIAKSTPNNENIFGFKIPCNIELEELQSF